MLLMPTSSQTKTEPEYADADLAAEAKRKNFNYFNKQLKVLPFFYYVSHRYCQCVLEISKI